MTNAVKYDMRESKTELILMITILKMAYSGYVDISRNAKRYIYIYKCHSR